MTSVTVERVQFTLVKAQGFIIPKPFIGLGVYQVLDYWFGTLIMVNHFTKTRHRVLVNGSDWIMSKPVISREFKKATHEWIFLPSDPTVGNAVMRNDYRAAWEELDLSIELKHGEYVRGVNILLQKEDAVLAYMDTLQFEV